jgi:glutamyl-tRNA reductase
MNLLVVGASHRTADVALLEQLTVPTTDLPGMLGALLRREHVTEVVVLSTCNRVEMYAGVTSFHGGVADLSAALAERAGLDPGSLASHLYVHWDADAVTHALRVAAGLDSMVAGEAQILGQVREAYGAAAAADATGRLLHEVMQQALRVGKRVHAETGIDAAGRNIVTAALTTAAGAIGSLEGRRALVIGAGSMGGLALATLTRAGAGPRFIANRDTGRAHRLAAAYDAQPVGMDALAATMATVDIVVTVTASTQPVLAASTVQAALAHRPAGRGPLVICDLAVPRDVEPAAAELPGVLLLDLERLADTVPEASTAEVTAAERIVAAESAAIGSALRDTQIAPTVAALRARADEVVAAELDRLAHRCPDLTDQQRAEVAHAVHRLVQRLLHQPTVRVRQLAAEPGGESYAAVLAELFDLQLPTPRRADELPALEPNAYDVRTSTR